MSIHINVNNAKKKIKESFINVNGVKKKVKSIWVGKDGVASKIYSSAPKKLTSGFICVGDNGCLYHSTNGNKFEKLVLIDPNVNLRGITFRNNMFVVLGMNIGYAYYSTDGINWTISKNSFNKSQVAMTYGNGKFVCVGYSGTSFYSTNGINWTPIAQTGFADTFQDITYGNGRFVCVGYSGVSYYSTNGTSWSKMTGISADDDILSVAFGYLNRNFVCVGRKGASYYSTNGTSWSKMTGISTNDDIGAVAFGYSRFSCTGCDYSGVTVAYTEAGGTRWSKSVEVQSGTYGRQKSIAYGTYSTPDGAYIQRFVSVGEVSMYDSTGSGDYWDRISGLPGNSEDVIYVEIPS